MGVSPFRPPAEEGAICSPLARLVRALPAPKTNTNTCIHSHSHHMPLQSAAWFFSSATLRFPSMALIGVKGRTIWVIMTLCVRHANAAPTVCSRLALVCHEKISPADTVFLLRQEVKTAKVFRVLFRCPWLVPRDVALVSFAPSLEDFSSWVLQSCASVTTGPFVLGNRSMRYSSTKLANLSTSFRVLIAPIVTLTTPKSTPPSRMSSGWLHRKPSSNALRISTGERPRMHAIPAGLQTLPVRT